MKAYLCTALLFMANVAAAQDEAKKIAEVDSFEPSNVYVHKWIKIPTATGQSVRSETPYKIKPIPGHATVVVFLASYDEPSQQLIMDFMRMQRKYEPIYTDFHYVFSHDTREDALGFMEEFNIKKGVLSNHTILKEYHNPDLPTIFIGDRNGWMTRRFVGAKSADLPDLENFMRHLTAL